MSPFRVKMSPSLLKLLLLIQMTNTKKRYEAETKRQAMFQRMKVNYDKNAIIDVVNIVYHVKYNGRWPGHLY